MIDALTKQQVSDIVAAHLGLNFPVSRWKDLERGIHNTCKELNTDSVESFISSLLSAQLPAGHLEVLSTHLTVGETYFFREKAALNAFKNDILPVLLNQRRGKDQTIRIWSAGCCTGEEPYSIAILLSETIPDPEHWKISILATDINRNFLEKAIQGVYTSWSFRETPPGIKEKYFTSTGKEFVIHPSIRKMVNFFPLNLVKDCYPAPTTRTDHLDIIFCRNVLMYFTPEQISRVAQRLFLCLNEQGWFLTSPVEVSNAYFSQFSQVSISDCILYRKITNENEGSFNPVFTKRDSPQSLSVPHAGEGMKRESSRKTTRKSTSAIPKKSSPLPPVKKSEPLSLQQEAESLFRIGRYQEVVDLLQGNTGTGLSEPGILMLKARAHANLGQLAAARQCLDQHPGTDHMGASAYYLLATIFLESKENVQAEQALNRALYLDPHHIMSHFLTGDLSRSRGDKKQALKHFNNVTEMLNTMAEDDIVPDSDGLTAGRLMDLCNQLKKK